MILAHVIALDATAAQEQHFRKACGVARLAYNWALAEWKRKYEAGERPSAYKLKIKWNEIRRSQFPFTLEVTKCAGSQAILNLGDSATSSVISRSLRVSARRDIPASKRRASTTVFHCGTINLP